MDVLGLDGDGVVLDAEVAADGEGVQEAVGRQGELDAAAVGVADLEVVVAARELQGTGRL